MNASLLGVVGPFTVALVVAGLARLMVTGRRGAVLAGAALPVGLLAGWWLVFHRLPALPPRPGQSDLVPLVALAGLALGLALDLLGGRRLVLAGAVVFAVAACWLALGTPLAWSARSAVLGLTLLAAWLAVLLRLATRPPAEPGAAVLLLAGALGLGGVTAIAGEPAFAASAFVLAGAAAGFLAWNWALAVPFLAIALLGGGGALAALAAAAALTGRVPPVALALLLLIPFADGTARRLPTGSGALARVLAPLWLMLAATLPLALALVAAWVGVHLRR